MLFQYFYIQFYNHKLYHEISLSFKIDELNIFLLELLKGFLKIQKFIIF